MRLRAFFLALLLLFTLSVWGADEEQTMTLNLNEADIRAFIATVSEMTGKNFIIDPRVKGKVTVVSGTPVSPDRLYDIFLSVLKVQGYSAVPSGDAIKIVPSDSAKQDSVPIEQGDVRDDGDKLVTRVVQVQHADAAQLVPILRPLLPQYAYLAAHANSNTLVVADSAGNIDRMVAIIRRIDQANNRDIEIIPLQHSLASDLEKTLNSLSKVAVEQGQAPGKAPLLISDDRTNSLILSGDPNWRANMRIIIAQLDVAVQNEDNTEVIYLRYASAKDMVGVLRGVGAQQLRAKTEGAQAGGTGTQFDIQADESTNALVVTAPPFLMRSLKSVIEKLDIRRAQVQIEAIIAEIRNDRAIELGVEWQSNPQDTGGVGGTNLPLTNGVTSSIISYDPLAIPATGIGSGFTLGFFRGGRIQALIKAFAGDDDTNILSTPSLITLDNEEAMIHVGKNVPFITGQYANADSVGGSNPFQTIERHDVGIKLRVTPHINEGDTIRMKIEQEVSNVDSSTSASDLVTNMRIIQTTVLVDNREIIVLGGLIEDTLTESVSKVPFLGDLPMLGLLFQSRRDSMEKRNLMVFLRPEIIRDQTVGRQVTDRQYQGIRQLQEEAREKGILLMPGEQPPVLPQSSAPPQSTQPIPYEPPVAPEPDVSTTGAVNPFAEYQQLQ